MSTRAKTSTDHVKTIASQTVITAHETVLARFAARFGYIMLARSSQSYNIDNQTVETFSVIELFASLVRSYRIFFRI